MNELDDYGRCITVEFGEVRFLVMVWRWGLGGDMNSFLVQEWREIFLF
jgi:hypothetical protein